MGSEQIPSGQMLIYRDGSTQLQVRLDGQTVWLTQAQMAELFQTSPQNITIHIKGIYEEGEQEEGGTCKEYLQVRTEGGRQVKRVLRHYSLDMILAVGYRVRSPRGTAFRQRATAQLSELLVKGFVLDDERIKAGRTIGRDYFDELLARIRDIRTSERLFYQKNTDSRHPSRCRLAAGPRSARVQEPRTRGWAMGSRRSKTTFEDLIDKGLASVQTGPFGSQLHPSDYVDQEIRVVPTEAIGLRHLDISVMPQIR